MVNRLKEVDILRGLAIVFMIVANYSPYLVYDPPNFLRFIYTLAAPIFISIAGLMMYRNKILKNYEWNYYIKRGLILIIIACLIDILIYGNYPFFSFDVLYLIGFCVSIFPFLFTIYKKSVLSIIFIFLFSFTLQAWLGYNSHIMEYSIGEKINMDSIVIFFRQMLFEGYFPVFPWVGLFMIAFVFQDEKYKDFINKFWYLGVIFFVIFSFWLLNTERYIREGYAELFYPPDYVFILWAISFLFLVFYLLYKKFYLRLSFLSGYLELIGKYSLFFYIFHLFLVDKILRYFDISKFLPSIKIENPNYLNLFLSYFLTLFIIYFIALFFENIRKRKLLS